MDRKYNDQELFRIKKLKELQELEKDPFQVESVHRTLTLSQFISKYDSYSKDELHNGQFDTETLCGRIIGSRQTFLTIKDFSSTCQLYINKKNNPEVFDELKFTDIGDIIAVKGQPMKTMTNQTTLNVNSLQIVSKSLKVLPEKFHGLQDEETRTRQRYLDLIVNEKSMQTFVLRSKIIKLLRNFMDDQDYIEVETPVLQATLGGAAARPFITHHNALDREFYLRIATEIPLKQLIVGGFEKIYEIGRIFRNEGIDSTHNPEFTSMEAYTAYAGMDETMDFVEAIFNNLTTKLNVKKLNYRGFEIDLTKKFKRLHMVDFIKQETKVDFWKINDVKQALKIASEHQIKLEKHQHTIGHIINMFYEKYCEEKCIQPTFVYGHPIDVSPLSKKDYANPNFTKRFELFIGQKEFANAFAELNDPIDQYERFSEQLKEKSLGNDEANEMDMDFITALEYGLPPTGGLGLGIDRLVMLYTENDSIRNVLLFPHTKEKA